MTDFLSMTVQQVEGLPETKAQEVLEAWVKAKKAELPLALAQSASKAHAKLANASFGLRYYLTERFIVRTDYSIYTAFVGDTRSAEYRAGTIGLSFFF